MFGGKCSLKNVRLFVVERIIESEKSGRNDLGFMLLAIWTLKYTMCSFSNCHNVIFVFYVHFKHPSRIYDASIKALDSKVPWKMTVRPCTRSNCRLRGQKYLRACWFKVRVSYSYFQCVVHTFLWFLLAYLILNSHAVLFNRTNTILGHIFRHFR